MNGKVKEIMENSKHYPTHPGAEHPPIMTCEIPLEEYESLKRENEELKAENERLVKCCKEYDSRQRIDERIKFNGAQQLRATKHALWFSRAKAYRYIAELLAGFNPDYVRNRKMFTPNNPKQKQMNSLKWARLMLKIESKCRAKAEEYK